MTSQQVTNSVDEIGQKLIKTSGLLMRGADGLPIIRRTHGHDSYLHHPKERPHCCIRFSLPLPSYLPSTATFLGNERGRRERRAVPMFRSARHADFGGNGRRTKCFKAIRTESLIASFTRSTNRVRILWRTKTIAKTKEWLIYSLYQTGWINNGRERERERDRLIQEMKERDTKGDCKENRSAESQQAWHHSFLCLRTGGDGRRSRAKSPGRKAGQSRHKQIQDFNKLAKEKQYRPYGLFVWNTDIYTAYRTDPRSSLPLPLDRYCTTCSYSVLDSRLLCI